MPNKILFDFKTARKIEQWRNIDNVVMGGKSHSRISWDQDGQMVFSGTLCTAPGSGFASIRSVTDLFDLSAYRGLAIRLKGDGLRYRLTLRCTEDFDAIAYQAAFTTEAATRQVVRLPWRSFVPTHHGRVLNSAPPLDPSRIRSFGFVLADKQTGPFRLEISRIETLAGDRT